MEGGEKMMCLLSVTDGNRRDPSGGEKPEPTSGGAPAHREDPVDGS